MVETVIGVKKNHYQYDFVELLVLSSCYSYSEFSFKYRTQNINNNLFSFMNTVQDKSNMIFFRQTFLFFVNSILITTRHILQLGEKSALKDVLQILRFSLCYSKVCFSVKSQTSTLKLLLFFRTVPSCGEISTTILRQLNPHLLFISFAESVEFDHSLLLDLLISSETRFLEYLVQYLHFVIGRWSSFVQCLAEYQEKISCSAEEAMDDDVAMCSVRLKEFESDSNAFEKRTEFESRVANEIRSRENESLFVRQENLGAEVDLGLETSKVHVFRRFSRTNAVTGEDRQCPELPDTFSAFQNNSCKKCETSPELCQCDSRLLGIPSGELNGLTSIVLAYSSSDESEVENADENESANDHVGSAVSQSDEQSDSIICSSVCLNNNKLGSSPFDKADSTETFHSSFTAKSCSGLLQNVSGTPRKHTNNLNNSLFTEHSGFSSNQPVGDSDLKVDGCLGSSSSTKPFPSSDRNTETCVAKESHTEGSVTNSTVVECELLDKVMTMLIRLRLSVARLSSGGHFPYSAAPLMTLMENVEKCYDGC